MFANGVDAKRHVSPSIDLVPMENQLASFCPGCGEREIDILAIGHYLCIKCKVQFQIITSGPVISVGDLELHREARKVRVRSQDVPMTALEFKMMEFLMLHKGVVYDRNAIIKAVWANNTHIDGHNVDVIVRRIRMKIESDHKSPRFILTTKGLGYSFADN
jgi:DNA-binding response OmpR family regulator